MTTAAEKRAAAAADRAAARSSDGRTAAEKRADVAAGSSDGRTAAERKADATAVREAKPDRNGLTVGEVVTGWKWDGFNWVEARTKSGHRAPQNEAPEGFKVAEGSGYDSKPDRDGRYDEEVVGKYKWNMGAKSWEEYVGRDRTQPENIPADHVHLGDGTEANPHRIVPISRW